MKWSLGVIVLGLELSVGWVRLFELGSEGLVRLFIWTGKWSLIRLYIWAGVWQWAESGRLSENMFEQGVEVSEVMYLSWEVEVG